MIEQFTCHFSIKYTTRWNELTDQQKQEECKARLYTKNEDPFIVGRWFEQEKALGQYI